MLNRNLGDVGHYGSVLDGADGDDGGRNAPIVGDDGHRESHCCTEYDRYCYVHVAHERTLGNAAAVGVEGGDGGRDCFPNDDDDDPAGFRCFVDMFHLHFGNSNIDHAGWSHCYLC